MVGHDLEPVPSRGWRIGWMVALWTLAAIGSTPIAAKAGFAVTTLLLCGTYRRFRVTPNSLLQRWTVGFVNLSHKSFKLRRYSFIEVNYERPTGIMEFLMFGVFAILFGWIVDRCFPWVAGAYQIWLNNEADDRVLAW